MAIHRDFMHKQSYVWYTEMLTQPSLSTIKRVFLCTMFAGGTRVLECTFTMEQRILFLKVPLQLPKPELSMGVKSEKCKMWQMVPFLMCGHKSWLKAPSPYALLSEDMQHIYCH